MITLLFVLVFIGANSVFGCSDNQNALDCIQSCFGDDTESCLTQQLAGLIEKSFNIVPNQESRSIDSRFDSIQNTLTNRVAELLGFDEGEEGRGNNMLRTYRKAWKVLIPLLIGVMLKLATFVPLVIVVFTLMAKGAVLSSNLAVLLSGLSLFLKYVYPKWSAPQETNHNLQHEHANFEQYYSKVNEPYHHYPYNSEVS